MNRDWNDFKSLHSNIAGARESFEGACETLFRKIYKNLHVSQVQVKQGDGGIDIFIGEFEVEPITVIQCKFFLNAFEESQKAQIRSSFDTAINSDKYKLKEWILCIPRVIDIDENSWWFNWKHKKLKEFSKSNEFIKLKNGNELIDLLKENGLYNQVFQIEDSIKIDEIYQVLVPKKIIMPSSIKPNLILFNNYSSKNEPYYLERNQDSVFKQSLSINHIWLFGKSGVGKTALANRNLLNNGIDYCFCDLSPIEIVSSEDVLEEILCSIEEKFNLERNCKEQNKIKLITQLLCKTGQKKIVILIDELSVNDGNLLKSITNNLTQLVTHFSNKSEQEDLKFVISTISDPRKIADNRSKASDYFQYICCDCWIMYLGGLFDILNKFLCLHIEEHKNFILEQSNDSPRILKNIFRKIVALNDTRALAISEAVNMSIAEIIE